MLIFESIVVVLLVVIAFVQWKHYKISKDNEDEKFQQMLKENADRDFLINGDKK